MKVPERIQNLKGYKKALCLVLCSFAFALPFINESFWLCSWFSLSGLLLNLDLKNAGKRVLGSLFLFFCTFYFFSYIWFASLYPLDFAGLSNIESVGVILCATLLIPLVHGSIMSFCVYLSVLSCRGQKREFSKILTLTSGYVLGEFLQGVGTFAFPWTPLFVGQTKNIYLLQSAALLGARFVTFLIVLVNVLLAFALINGKKKYAVAALTIFVLNFGFGIVRVETANFDDNKKISVMALQGNISSTDKWSGGSEYAGKVYTQLAQKAKQEWGSVDVAVLPETAFPTTFYEGSSSVKASKQISKILGAETFVGAFRRTDDDYFNSLYVFSPDGSIGSETYNKVNLVPFGEFLPYRNIIAKNAPAFADMNMFSSDLTEGTNLISLETKHGNAACLVCFDSIFPDTARQQVKNGGQFFVVSTNDSWYKQSKALDHHASQAVMRAIENNRAVVRSANTGISSIVSPIGGIIAESGVNTREYIVGKVPLNEELTLYTKIGDIVTPMCLALLALALLKRIKNNLPKH